MRRALSLDLRTHVATFLLVASILVAGCATTGRGAGAKKDRDLAQLVEWMTGSFSSTAQHESDPDNFYDIRLHMVPIWPARRDATWMYVEQSAAATPDKPYRQRVYRISREADRVLESRVFELPGDPLRFVGAWRERHPLALVSPEQLTPRKGCAILLRRSPNGWFEGSTPGRECTSTLRGASYATSEVTVASWGLRTWDRGFDAAGKQVWGSTAGPYEFRRSVEKAGVE
ncbi:MAG: chromophore lyase CpcT/CpeT [Phycisphaerae bacterium]|nr:chromophore lyase CpcT/CpeT [Phycisphaerae bacterium]